MMFFITAATILAALFQVILAQDLRINTVMNCVQCQPVQFTWTGGAPPYYLSLGPGGQAGAEAIKQFPVQNGNFMTWTVDLPAGTNFTSTLRDSTGAQAFSDIQKVQTGPDSSCLNGSSTTTSPASAASSVATSNTSAASINTATTPNVAGASQRGTPTTLSASGSTSVAQVHAASSSVTGAAPTSSNAASTHASAGAIGIAGLLGLAGAALLG